MASNELIERTRASIREHQFTTLLAKPQSGVYLFFSFDLVNSTQFKASHPDDWPVAAVALLLGLPIWTEDQDFFGSGIATWTTDRVELFLREL